MILNKCQRKKKYLKTLKKTESIKQKRNNHKNNKRVAKKNKNKLTKSIIKKQQNKYNKKEQENKKEEKKAKNSLLTWHDNINNIIFNTIFLFLGIIHTHFIHITPEQPLEIFRSVL